MTNKWLPLALIAAFSAILAWILLLGQPGDREGGPHQVLDLTQRPQGGDFTLRSAAGTVSLADMRGSVVLLYFGYTWCPDVCPTNLGYISQALGQMTDSERRQVRVLFVSVDPERDDPKRLADYAAFFAPEVLGVTGSAEEVARVAALYGAAYRRVELRESAAGYLVDHSAYTYLIDPSGRLAGQLDHATAPSKIVAAVRGLLAGG
jgi:protein SCO1/2